MSRAPSARKGSDTLGMAFLPSVSRRARLRCGPCSLGNNLPDARFRNQRHQRIRDEKRAGRETGRRQLHLLLAESHFIGGWLPLLCSLARAQRWTVLPSWLLLTAAAGDKAGSGSLRWSHPTQGPQAWSLLFLCLGFLKGGSRAWGWRKDGGRCALEEERVSASLPAFGDTARKKRVESYCNISSSLLAAGP